MISELTLSENSNFLPFVSSFEYPWQATTAIKKYAETLIATMLNDNMTLFGVKFCKIAEDVYVADDGTVKISDGADIQSPTVIFPECDIRRGAFIRGSAVIGRGCVVGNSSEIKNSLLFDSVKIPHFNYVGDSVLFDGAHLGAGAIISNVRCDKGDIGVTFRGVKMNSGLHKLGAMVGAGCEVGCGCVINPGSFIGKNSMVYPLQSVAGYVAPNTVVKHGSNINNQ